MSIDWNWGIFLQQAPFGNTTYLGWIWSGFQVTIALSICAWIIGNSSPLDCYVARTDYTPDGRSPSGLKTAIRWVTIFEGSS